MTDKTLLSPEEIDAVAGGNALLPPFWNDPNQPPPGAPVGGDITPPPPQDGGTQL